MGARILCVFWTLQNASNAVCRTCAQREGGGGRGGADTARQTQTQTQAHRQTNTTVLVTSGLGHATDAQVALQTHRSRHSSGTEMAYGAVSYTRAAITGGREREGGRERAGGRERKRVGGRKRGAEGSERGSWRARRKRRECRRRRRSAALRLLLPRAMRAHMSDQSRSTGRIWKEGA
eukprot:1486173-Rhodomonas_salina.7